MLETDPPTPSSTSASLRALVVDGDDQRRLAVEQSLHAEGVRVHGCASVDHGRELFDDHALVITPLNGDNEEVLEFVSWLRTRAGRIQPYVMGLGEYRAPASEWHGFNEFVSLPFEGGKVVATVEAARRWHGWTVGVSLLTQAEEPTPPIVVEVPQPAANPSESTSASQPVLDVTEIFASAQSDSLAAAESEASEKSLIEPTAEQPSAAEITPDEPAAPFDWSDTKGSDVAPHTFSAKQDPPSHEPVTQVKPVRPPGAASSLPTDLKLAMAPGAKPTMTESLHQQITEASPFGLLMLDDSANLIYANPQHRNVLGLSVEAAGGLQGWLERGCVAEPGQQRGIIEGWYEQVWRRRLPMVMTMRSAESLLKEIEFRPSPLSDERLLIAIFDVTDARREEESMRASEARFRNLFLQAPFGVVVVNAVGNITDASLLFEQMVGCSRLDMRRLGMEHFFTDAALNLLRKMSFSARAGIAVAPLAIELKSRQGEILPVLCDLRIVKNSQGAPVFTAYYLHPQPDPASAMPAPAKSDIPEKPNPLLQAVPDLVLELSAEGVIISHLPTRDFADLLPRLRNIVGQSFEKAFPILTEMVPWQEMVQNLEDSLDTEVRCEFRYRILPTDPPRFCEARMVPLVAVGDLAEHRFGLLIRDLTHTVASQSPVSSERSTGGYEFTAIALLRQAAIVTNEKGRICNVNPAAEALFGYEKSELMGGGLYKLFLPEQPKEFAQKISEHINRHRCWIGKSSFFRKDGTVGRVAVELVPFDDNGSKGFLGLMRDITGEESSPAPAAEAPSKSSSEAPAETPMVTLHRARNDLQVLSSLLSLQANDSALTDSARHALQESKDRVAAVALIYRLVDSTTGLVNFNQFAAELSGQILRSHQVADGRIKVKTSSGPAPLKQKLALNLGLILQEMLASIVAHSFPGAAGGTIEIKLDLAGNDGVLCLKDDGAFHTEAVQADRKKGVGWKVVEALSQQIHGELKILSDLANETHLRFKLDSSDQA